MTAIGFPDDFIYRDPPHAHQLRERIRELVRLHLPPGWLGPFTDDPADLAISNRFCRLLSSEGLLVPNWPSQYGGQDLDLASSVVIREEMWGNFEPRGAQYYGPNWVGPSIFDYGTEEQKAFHLPLIAAGNSIWCQGFSEPDAGSDLAHLATRALHEGEGFRITGQKTWTSWALWAHWCYLLAKVEGPDGPEGITVFLLPMDREGITVRGLDGIPGPHHLNEVFFDGVWAEPTEVLGGVGQGRRVIRDALLANERVGIARYARGDHLMARLEAEIGAPDGGDTPGLVPRAAWMAARVRNRMARLMVRRALWFQSEGGSHDFVVCAARMITTRADLQVADVCAEALGDRFFEGRSSRGAPVDGAIDFFWRYMQAGTIASGTTEMLQRQLSNALFRGERIRVTEHAEEIRSIVDKFVTGQRGVGTARTAISDPDARRRLCPLFEELIETLDPRVGPDEGFAAAEVCRGAGHGVLPLPVEALLLRRASALPLALLSPGGRFEHGDLFDAWELADANGLVRRFGSPSGLIGSKVGPFVNLSSPPEREPSEPLTPVEQSLLYILPSWYVLGALEKALDLAATYATERVAFGAPIATYQGVAFPLADACAELQALYELARHALWSVHRSPATCVVDALALRWATLEIGRRVLRICHQVLGAIGLCDEHDLAVITLCLQGRLRLPTDQAASLEALAQAAGNSGFTSLYGDR